MNQRQLRKTIASFYTKKFDSTPDLLAHVTGQIVAHAGIDITGGRVWRLIPGEFSYELIAQVGAVQQIREHYKLRADRYALFTLLPRQRVVVLQETDTYLRRKGIIRYSATGVGEELMRTVIAKTIADLIDLRGLDAAQATAAGIAYLSRKVRGRGGVIVIDHAGRCASGFTTQKMLHGWIEHGGAGTVRF